MICLLNKTRPSSVTASIQQWLNILIPSSRNGIIKQVHDCCVWYCTTTENVLKFIKYSACCASWKHVQICYYLMFDSRVINKLVLKNSFKLHCIKIIKERNCLFLPLHMNISEYVILSTGDIFKNMVLPSFIFLTFDNYMFILCYCLLELYGQSVSSPK